MILPKEITQSCRRCLQPGQALDTQLDENRICNFCRDYKPIDRAQEEQIRCTHETDLEQALRNCRGISEYDCLVPLSGGKDSIYLLYKLKTEYGLKVLAHTTDINIGKIAWANIYRALDKLDIEHFIYRPSIEFYRKLFRFLLTNQETRGAVHTVSYVYASLFEGNALQVATTMRIPLILAGYSPGQPIPDRMIYEMPKLAISDVDWTPPELRESVVFNKSDFDRFWNPHRFPSNTKFPRYLAPFHAWPYNQDEIMRKVVTLDLIDSVRHASPIYSNYPINWLLMYSDLKNFGYNPYNPEFSTLIREGKASLWYWRFMAPFVNYMLRHKFYLGREVQRHLDWLELKDDDLIINRPSRRDWPDYVYQSEETLQS